MSKLPEGYFSLKEIAEYGHVTRQAVFVSIRQKKLPGTKFGKFWGIKKEDYDAFRANKYNREERKMDGEYVFDASKGQYSVQQVAKVFSSTLGRHYDKQRIYYLIHTGQLKASRKGYSWVISKEDAVELLEKETNKQPTQISFA